MTRSTILGRQQRSHKDLIELMFIPRLFCCYLLFILMLPSMTGPAAAREEGSKLPIQAERSLEIAPQRTTWTSLDISPDGKTIIFDVLGDLFIMPSQGGAARQLTFGLPFDNQPVFSPNGAKIAYISDRNGAENLWIADLDGHNARMLSSFDDDTSLATPEWAIDGETIYASRFRPDLNGYEVWSFGPQSDPNRIIPAKPGHDAGDGTRSHNGLGFSASPDGEYLFYARRIGGLSLDASVRWTIVRRNLASGHEQEIIAGSGGRGTSEESYFAPRLSPEGSLLAYVMRDAGKSQLRIRNLATGKDWAIGQSTADSLQASSWLGHVPRYDFTKDGKAIILSHDGQFERRSIEDGSGKILDRQIAARVAVAPTTRIELDEDDGPVAAKLAMSPAPSPDGRYIAFVALGELHIADIEGSTRSLDIEIEAPAHPSWSADGSEIVFVSWSEAEGGAVHIAPADGSSPARRITTTSAYWRHPAFAPDGTVYAFRSATDARRQSSFEFGTRRASQLVRIAPDKGPEQVLTSGNFGGRIHFDDHGNPLILAEGGLKRLNVVSGEITALVNITGPGWYFSEAQAHADQIELSPDSKQAIALVSDRAYLFAIPDKTGSTIDVEANPELVKRVDANAADFLTWVEPGIVDLYSGTRWSRYDTATLKLLAEGSLRPSRPLAIPTGALLLQGGKLLTMANGDRVIPNADILIVGNRIAAIGPSGKLDVPEGTKRQNISGKWVMPGLIDVHDHIGSIRREVPAHELWGLRARLAFGITTSFDPSTLSSDLLEYEGLVDIGKVLGPRLRSTGPAIFSRTRLRSLDEARAFLRRYSQDFGIGNIKEYRTGDREVRQWLAIAAREQQLLPTTEGALSLKLDLTQILDGFAGNEHALPALPLGDDIIALMTAMRTSYVTTLSTTNSGAPAKDWMIAFDQFAQDERVARFWPPPAIRQKLAGTRDWSPLNEHRFPELARQAGRFAEAGGLLGMGSHGEAPGIGFHWEMEAHARGGMSTMAILHAATAGSAETIGRLGDLGTIEAGKLADLVILERDPTQDVRNARAISQVMRGGFLYDAMSLAQLWPTAKPAPRAWFDDFNIEYWLPVDQPDPADFYGH